MANQHPLRLSLAGSAALITMLSAQSTAPVASAEAALASPTLKANAAIIQHNPPGSPIGSTLSSAKASAPSRGIAWKGVDLIAFDSPAGLIADTALLDIHRKRACLADAIAIGHTIAESSHLSAFGTAVYTDYAFVPDTLLKDNARAAIRGKPFIVVTRPGGSIELPGGPVEYESQEFPKLLPRGAYLQLLRFIPQSGSYHAIDGFSTFVANGETWSIARAAVSARTLPEFKRGVLEALISGWLKACE
jgi:hypothetical protein